MYLVGMAIFVLCFWCSSLADKYPVSVGILVDKARTGDTTQTTLVHYTSNNRDVINVSMDTVAVDFSNYSMLRKYASQFDVTFLLKEEARTTNSEHTCPTSLTTDKPKDLTITGGKFYTESELFHVREDQDTDAYFRTEAWVVSHALWDIVTAAKWKVVAVISDHYTVSLAHAVSDMPLSHSQFVMYHVIPQGGEIEAIWRILRSIFSKEHHAVTNILVICEMENVKRLLRVANEFDSDNHTAMHMFSRFLVISPAQARGSIVQMIGHLDNVAVVMENGDRPTSVRTDNVQTAVQEIMYGVLKKVTKSHQGEHISARDMLDYIKAQLTTDMDAPDFDVYTATWSRERKRVFDHVTSWSKSHGLTSPGDIFPNTKQGFNGRHYLIATHTWPSFVDYTDEHKTKYHGLSINLLDEMARSLNFTYTLTEPADGQWGTRLPNGRWTGLVGMLQNRSVFAVFSALSMSAERSEVVDYVLPFSYDYFSVFMRRPDPDQLKWKTLLSIYSWHALVAIILAVPVMSAVVYSIERNNPYYTRKGKTMKQWPYNKFINVFWYLYGSLLSQGGIHLPMSWAGRISIIAWWLFSILITVTFSGNLIASLTVAKEVLPFATLDDLAAQNEYRYGTLGGGVLASILEMSNREEYKRVWSGIWSAYQRDPSVLDIHHDNHLVKMQAGKYAYLCDKLGMADFVAQNCDIMRIKQDFISVKAAIALQKDSPYLNIINNEMMRILEGGLIEIWKQEFWSRPSFCPDHLSYTGQDVSLLHVQSAFYVLFIGVTLALIVLVTEKCLSVFCVRLRPTWEVNLNHIASSNMSDISTISEVNEPQESVVSENCLYDCDAFRLRDRDSRTRNEQDCQEQPNKML